MMQQKTREMAVKRLKRILNAIYDKMKKCTGESGDIGDIAKNVNIAMQKNIMRL